MKISICIPIFNFCVKDLVTELEKQIEKTQDQIDICLIDDGSELIYKQNNRKIINPNLTYLELEHNIGRSKIRNMFLGKTMGDYLLFLDCDGLVDCADFLKNYLVEIKKNKQPKVIYGGRKVETQLQNTQYYLRWNYARNRENPSAKIRKSKVYLCFQTNNFIIHRSLFQKNGFDESIRNYGYEDLIFAMNLKEKKIPILHIENPILNHDIENNALYLEKTKQALFTLYKLHQNPKTQPYTQEIKLIRFYEKSHFQHWNFLIRWTFPIFKKPLHWLLKTKKMPILFFDLYKLGYFSWLNK